jgi:hypothetical protein
MEHGDWRAASTRIGDRPNLDLAEQKMVEATSGHEPAAKDRRRNGL